MSTVRGPRRLHLRPGAGAAVPAADERAEERVLVRRARGGDTAAFGELARRHQDAIYRLAARMVGPDAAEDVAQAAFLRAWVGLERFAGEAAFGTWLYRIATNLCLDQVRRAARFRPLPPDEAATILADDGDPAETVVAAAEGEERRAALARALDALPHEDRLLLALRAGEGLSYEAIGEILALNPRTVGTRLYRARARLGRLMRGGAVRGE